jgi:hypothetical protein
MCRCFCLCLLSVWNSARFILGNLDGLSPEDRQVTTVCVIQEGVSGEEGEGDRDSVKPVDGEVSERERVRGRG